MFKFSIIPALLLLCQSCQKSDQESTFVLEGTIKGNSPEYIFLEYGTIKDSSTVLKNQFYFEGTIKSTVEASFFIPPASAMLDDWFYLENSKLKVNLNIEKKNLRGHDISLIKIDTLMGSKTEVIKKDFNDFEKLNRYSATWNDQLFNKLEEVIGTNSNSAYSGHLLAKYCKDSVLNNLQKKQLFNKLDTSSLSHPLKEKISRLINPQKSMEVGNQMKDFELANNDGELTNTNSFRGKILLIDFWASWCGPCRKINPELLTIYKEYKNKGMEIVGVSLDRDEEKWKRAIKDDDLIWENVIEPNGFEGKVASKYNINAIPSNFLIDTKGKIIKVDISVEELKLYLLENL